MVTVADPTQKQPLDMMEVMGFNSQAPQAGPQFGAQPARNPAAGYSMSGGNYARPAQANSSSRNENAAAFTGQPNQIPLAPQDWGEPGFQIPPNQDVNDPYAFMSKYLPNMLMKSNWMMNQSPLRSGQQPLYSTHRMRNDIASEANSYWNSALNTASNLANSRYTQNEENKRQQTTIGATERENIKQRAHGTAMQAIADLQNWVNTFATQMVEKAKKVDDPGVLRDAYRKIFDNKLKFAEQMWDQYAAVAGVQLPFMDYFGDLVASLNADFDAKFQGIDFSDNQRGNPR